MDENIYAGPGPYACVLLLNKPERMQRRGKPVKEYVVQDTSKYPLLALTYAW